MFSTQPHVVLLILLLTMLLFVWGRWRFDVVAIISLAITTLIGAIPYSKVYLGLANPAVITVACVMIISNALSRTGVLDLFVSKISHLTKNQVLHVAILAALACVLSAFMNNIAALALILPIAIKTSFENNRSPSIILMPIAFASALGGMTTLIGTPPNLIISTFREQFVGLPFTMFDYSYVGLPITIFCIIFIALIGWRFMPVRNNSTSKQLEDIYQIQEYITEIKIPDTSPFVGKKVRELEKSIEDEFVIVGLIRDKTKRLIPNKNYFLQANDILIVEASTDTLDTLVKAGKLELAISKSFSNELLKSDEISVMEAIIPEDSKLEDRTIQKIRLRSRFGINLLGIARQGVSIKTRLNQTILKPGDVILLQGETSLLRENIINLGLIPLAEREITVGKPSQTYLPFIIFFISILLAGFQILPVEISFGGAVLSLVLLRSIPVRLLYDSIDWPIIILLAAMIPVGTAFQTTGGTQLISHYFVEISKYVPHWVILLMILVSTMTLSDFMNNTATAIVMAPIAGTIANALHLSVDPFLMAVTIGASCSFLTPIGHQNNTLVMGPGGYHFNDYIRLGLPLEIMITICSIPLILLIWPMNPY